MTRGELDDVKELIEFIKEHEAYYMEFFREYDKRQLFKVYDVENNSFIVPAGTEGSVVMNKNSLIKYLIEVHRGYTNTLMENLIVITYDGKMSDFTNPAFIGAEDMYNVSN